MTQAPLNCLDDAVLLRLAEDPNATPSDRRHLQGCGLCRRRLSRLRREQAALLTAGRALDAVCCDVMEPPARPDASGRGTAGHSLPLEIGRFRVRSRIAGGGQADLFLSTHPTLGCDVVIKLSKHCIADSAGAAVSIEHEGRALAALQHPGLPQVFESDLHDGRPYLVLQLLDGARLDHVLKHGPPGTNSIIARLIQVADAVDAAHQQGLLHLDLKPENVLVTEHEQAKLVDFGAAGLLLSMPDDTKEVVSFGTPEYMAPEQQSGDSTHVNRRTDVYGLGGLLYFQLFGEAPHAGNRALPTFEVADRPVWEDELRTSAKRSTIVHQLDADRRRLIAICRRALSSSMSGRPAAASHFADELRHIQSTDRRSVRQRATAALLVLLGLALAATASISALGQRRQQAPLQRLTLSPQVLSGTEAVPLSRALPLREGDQMRMELACNDPTTAGLYMVVSPETIIRCGPLSPSGTVPHRASFPGDGQGWPIGRLDECGLLLSARNSQGTAPSIAELRRALRTVRLHLPDDCNLIEFRGPQQESRADNYRLDGWKTSTAPEDVAAVRHLRTVLDENLGEYHALLFRFDVLSSM